MRRTLLLSLALASAGAVPVQAKTFRYYYAIQQEWEAKEIPASPMLGRPGEAVFETRLLPSSLFVLEADLVVDDQLILPKGEQLAQAESSKLVRCSLGPAAQPSLADDRRICVFDSDGDGALDAYFDEGLGMEFAQFQFTGCLPVEPKRATIPAMTRIDPARAKWPFRGRLILDQIKRKTDKQAGTEEYLYRFDFEIKRSDKPALRFSVCGANGGCWIPAGATVNLRDFLMFRPVHAALDQVAVEMRAPVRRKGYFDMRPGHRPDPIYCPGSLFVKTDQDEVWQSSP